MRLIAPFCRVRIAEDIFQTGDGSLLEVSVDLGEDSRASKCEFSIFDEGLVIGGRYQEISFKSGGIETPEGLLKDAKSSTPGATSSAIASTTPTVDGATPVLPTGGTGGASVLSRPTGRTKAAQASYYNTVWQSLKITREAIVREAGETAIKNQSRYQTISAKTGVPWYVIAAIHFRECSYDFKQNIANGDSLQRKTVRVPAGRIPGVAPPYTFEQAAIDALTSESKFKGVAWGSIPDMCWFFENYNGLGYLYKGKPSPYLLAGCQHYAGGLFVGDGDYRAGTVDGRSGVLPIIYYILNSKRTMIPASPPPTTPQIQAIPQLSQQQEVSQKGTEIIIELGFDPDQLTAYHFIHTGTNCKRREQTTTFTGQSIRWLMTRRTENKSFENITLRQLAQIVASKHNLKLEMEGSGPTYQFLDQTGITTYELLLRQCRSIGYSIQDEGNKLILKPSGRPEFTGIVLDHDIVLDLNFDDKARGDRTSSTGASTSSPPTPSADAKTVIDRQTGAVQQQKKEDTSGTGKKETTPPGVTGAAAPPVVGNVKPSKITSSTPPKATESPKKFEKEKKNTKTTKNADSSTTEITTITNKTIERGTITTKVETQTKVTKGAVVTTINKVVTTTETTKGTRIETENTASNGVISKSSTSNNKVSKEALDSLKLTDEYFNPPPAPVTANPEKTTDNAGLPRQPIGAIDLADGRAEGVAIADESKRIKGYESNASVITTPEILTLAPGTIIGISGNLVPAPFDREWRVSSVRHKFPGGVTEIQFYTPQAAPPQADVVSTPQPQQVASAVPLSAPGKFIFPVPKGATTIGDGYGTRPGRPAGYMHKILDVTAPMGTPAVAMADGVVKGFLTTGESGGGGNVVIIDYGGGYQSMFMHIMNGGFLVQKGQQVKQGQAIAKIGSTGHSSGSHLHLKFTLNEEACLLSKVGIDVLKMGLPIQRYNATCNQY
jgi:lysozyme family protein/phage protein D